MPDKRLNDTLDAYGRATAQKAVMEGHLYVAELLLRDWLEGLALADPVERVTALHRAEVETLVFLESLDAPKTPTGAAADGEDSATPVGQAS
jgi:hypothetical protein